MIKSGNKENVLCWGCGEHLKHRRVFTVTNEGKNFNFCANCASKYMKIGYEKSIRSDK